MARAYCPVARPETTNLEPPCLLQSKSPNRLGNGQPGWHLLLRRSREELECTKPAQLICKNGSTAKAGVRDEVKEVKGRAIGVLIGSDIRPKKGLFPPLLFLLYFHQVQMN